MEIRTLSPTAIAICCSFEIFCLIFVRSVSSLSSSRRRSSSFLVRVSIASVGIQWRWMLENVKCIFFCFNVVKSMTPNVPQALNEWFDMTNVLSLLINKTSQLNSILTMGLKQKNESYSFISSLLLFLITVSAYDTRLIDGSESSLYPRLLVSGLLSETIL